MIWAMYFVICCTRSGDSLSISIWDWSCVTVHSNDNANAGDSFQTFCGYPKRTILLDDIEDREDEEDLQDHLEIHFQKPSNYGGEIEHVRYTSRGKALQAFFLCEDTAEMDDWPAGAKPPTATTCKENKKEHLSNHWESVCLLWLLEIGNYIGNMFLIISNNPVYFWSCLNWRDAFWKIHLLAVLLRVRGRRPLTLHSEEDMNLVMLSYHMMRGVSVASTGKTKTRQDT